MIVIFRVPNGGGGLVQGLAYGELNHLLKEWKEQNGDCYTTLNIGYYRILDFKTKKAFRIFLKTFRPKREHWWKNAKINDYSAIKNEIRAMERAFKKNPPIRAAINHYLLMKQKLQEMELKGVIE